MLLYLSVLQMLAHFSAHLLMTRIASSIMLMLWILVTASVGGYMIHIGEIPQYLWWSESFSPQRWLLPVIIAEEFSLETLANTAGQQLCRNKHVSHCMQCTWWDHFICFVLLEFSEKFHLEFINSMTFNIFYRFKGRKSLCSIHAQYQMERKSCRITGSCVKITFWTPKSPNHSQSLHWWPHGLCCSFWRVSFSSRTFGGSFRKKAETFDNPKNCNIFMNIHNFYLLTE